jgi:hypothetical protein
MKTTSSILATLLVASVAFAGANGAASPFVRAQGDAGVMKDGPYIEVLVGATGFGSVNAVHVDLEYDPAGLEFAGFEAGSLFEDPLVLGPFDRKDRHVVDVTTATLTGAVSAAEGAVGTVRFRVLDEEKTDVRIVSFQTADGDWTVETQVSYENPVGASALPGVTRLVGNVPNPFNPTTEIRFELSKRTDVRLEVYNVSGQRVRTLASNSFAAGVHAVTWDGRDENGGSVSSGVYFYKLQAGEFSEAKRMTLVR